MDGPALTPRERQILETLEAELRADTELDLRLRTMRLHRLRRALHWMLRTVRAVAGLVLSLLVALAAVACLLVLTAPGGLRPTAPLSSLRPPTH